MRWVVDGSALDWVHHRLDDFVTNRVGSLVPAGFEAYARVLPPVRGGEHVRRWSDVAAWSGAAWGASTSFTDIATRRRPGEPAASPGPTAEAAGPDPDDLDPEGIEPDRIERWPGGVHQGEPEPDVAAALVDVLAADPSTSRLAGDRSCWFAVWEGHGWVWGGVVVGSTDPTVRSPTLDELPVPAHVRDGERAWRPYRSYVLYTGALDDALALVEHRWTFAATPDLWWAADRSWFVGSDIDLCCTYVGASNATVHRLLADPRLETQLVDLGDRLC